jgi:hypothetical protein
MTGPSLPSARVCYNKGEVRRCCRRGARALRRPPVGATLFMSSQPAHTPRTTAPPRRSGSPEPAPASGGGLDVGTLVIAAISSVVAATVVSRVWQAGTVMATAMTPVIVALVKEGLERPARRVSSIATRTAAAPVARASRAVAEPPPEAYAPPPPVGPDPGLSEMRIYRRERGTRRRWKLAVVTGLLACVIAIAAMTLPELVAGRSVVSGSHHTTIFGGHRATSSSKTSTPSDEKKKTTTNETTSIETQPQDTTTQPDTTTTAPDGQTQPGQTQPPAAAAPQTTQPPAQTQPPAATQPQTTTQPPATTP